MWLKLGVLEFCRPKNVVKNRFSLLALHENMTTFLFTYFLRKYFRSKWLPYCILPHLQTRKILNIQILSTNPAKFWGLNRHCGKKMRLGSGVLYVAVTILNFKSSSSHFKAFPSERLYVCAVHTVFNFCFCLKAKFNVVFLFQFHVINPVKRTL